MSTIRIMTADHAIDEIAECLRGCNSGDWIAEMYTLIMYNYAECRADGMIEVTSD